MVVFECDAFMKSWQKEKQAAMRSHDDFFFNLFEVFLILAVGQF